MSVNNIDANKRARKVGGTLIAKANGNGHSEKVNGHAGAQNAVTVDDFYAHMPTSNYLFVPTRELWPKRSVNARCAKPTEGVITKKVAKKRDEGLVEFEDVPLLPTEWLDTNHPIEQMCWAPGKPMIIADTLVSNGGWIERPGCSCFNLYRPPIRTHGNPDKAGRWLEHIRRVYPDDADHIVKWLGHRVQHPGEKINHGLVLGGLQGIGKDTLLEPVKRAVGPWNFVEVSPISMLGNFNGFVKSVILRISEARDLGDIDRFAFYDHTKVYTASPPDVLRCNEKNLREHDVMNVTGLIITTNYKTDGIYLPSDDRRHYVAWSPRTKDDFNADYWQALYRWYDDGCGHGHVAAYLASIDLRNFDPKAPPAKTVAFWDIVDAHRAPEDAELADALDNLQSPDVVTLTMLDSLHTDSEFRGWLQIEVSPFGSSPSDFRAGLISLRIMTAVDIAVRDPQAFAVATNVT